MASDTKVQVDLEVNDPNNVMSLMTAKNGWKTTEFWIALVMLALGTWLIEKGQDTLGAVIVAMSGTGYQASRTLVKRAVRVGVLLLALTLGGCHASCLTPENVGPAMTAVADRHDFYVNGDNRLTETEREVYTRTTALIRDVLREAGYVPEIDPPEDAGN